MSDHPPAPIDDGEEFDDDDTPDVPRGYSGLGDFDPRHLPPRPVASPHAVPDQKKKPPKRP